MLDRPQIVQTEAQPAAVIRLTIPREEIRSVMGPGMAELMAAVAAQGRTPAGPIFSHHLRMDPKLFDFEIGVPVTAPVSAACRVKAGELPGTTVARTVYHGPYEGLGPAWAEFSSWIVAEGHTPAPDLWECYVAGPESNPDPATWRTELNRPLIRQGGIRAAADRVGVTTFTTPSDREIVATRVVDAMRRLVWTAWTSPRHLPHWLLGPEGWTMPVCEIDLRRGGAWHYRWRRSDGTEMEMRGVYQELVPPERLVNTESWGGDWPETVNTLILSEEDGRTTMTCTVLYPTKEARDAAFGTGMKEGWSQSYDRLDEYLRTMRRKS